MLIENLKQKQKKLTDFYTSRGLHVYFREPLLNDEIDVEKVISNVESKLPKHLTSEVEMVIFGQFDEFAERNINAAYKDGALYISNFQDDEADLYDDIVHEISHSLEAPYGFEIYGDEKLKNEFLRKREIMHDLLWANGIKIPKSLFMNVEYDQEFDEAMYKDVGYQKLSQLLMGVFISPYAATSLAEYFATGFTEFYTHSEHKFLQKVSPELYKKIILLNDIKELDNRW